jgi:hypothetical protein
MKKKKPVLAVYTNGKYHYGNLFNVPTAEENKRLTNSLIKEIVNKLKNNG